MNIDPYREYFSEADFFKKIKNLAGILLKYAFMLYYVMSATNTPHWVRMIIIAALGYLICPLDAIPDFLPFGYCDDLTVLAALVSALDSYVTDEIKLRMQKG